jgi:ribosome-associated protein
LTSDAKGAPVSADLQGTKDYMNQWKDEEPVEKSRSQRKRESTAMQRLGEDLTRLPHSALAGLGVSAAVIEAVREYAAMKTHESRRRQMQYIGRMMREMDDAEAVVQRLAALKEGRQVDAEAFHHLERLREQLLLDDGSGMQALLEQYPQADVQHVRQLVRNARKERENQKPPKNYRALFRYLRDLEA